ncbi:MAG: hypothetical protein ABIN08_15120 [Caldimonas sp.]
MRDAVHGEGERLAAQLAANHSAVQKEVRDQSNSIAAALAEIDDRLRRAAG